MNPQIFRESDGYKSEDFLQSAYHHFEAARLLMSSSTSPDLFDSGGYLLHLSIELIFKSWLLHENKQFEIKNGKGHSLQGLRDKVCELQPTLKFSSRHNRIIEYFQNHFELRYPNRQKPTEIGSQDLDLAQELINKITENLPDDLYSKFEAIPFGTKGGRVYMEKPENSDNDFDLITNRQARI